MNSKCWYLPGRRHSTFAGDGRFKPQGVEHARAGLRRRSWPRTTRQRRSKARPRRGDAIVSQRGLRAGGLHAECAAAVRPVNHLVDDDQIIIRTRLSSAISTAVRAADPAVVVAYEADTFDPHRRVGWSVVGHRHCTNCHRSRRGLALRTATAFVGQPGRHRACHRSRRRHRLPDRREWVNLSHETLGELV